MPARGVPRVKPEGRLCGVRLNASAPGIVVSMPAPLAIMPTNIAKAPENVSLEVRQSGVDTRLLSADESRPHAVECACLSSLALSEEACFMTPVSSASTCAACRRP